VGRKRAQPPQEESPPERAAWGRECVAQAAESKKSRGEWFVVAQPGQAVLLRLAFSPPQAGQASAARVRAVAAVFESACLQERLAPELAQRGKVLAALAAAAAQASSQEWETTLVRAV